MNKKNKLEAGKAYWSKRTGNKITIISIEDDTVYYEIEGFTTVAPLFMPAEKFCHLVGIDNGFH